MSKNKILLFLGVFGSLLSPFSVFAHEVYVLPPEVVQRASALPAFSEWQTLLSNLNQFIFWGFIAVLVVFIVFFVSILRKVEDIFDPFLAKLPPFAPVISRVAIGISFLAGSYYRDLFGPELPISATFGEQSSLMIAVVLAVIGLMIIFGVYVRVAAVVALALFAVEIAVHGMYMLTYTNYLGETIMLLALGAHMLGVHGKKDSARHFSSWILFLKKHLAPYSFLILRVAFGVSLLYASLYAKIIHDNLALEVANAYPGVVAFFGFEPHFLVLGAAIVEIVIALFFILGIEIRFTSLFLLFWLSLSLAYFGEAVWPHVILIGIPIAFICYGYDKYSLEGYFFKKGRRQPVL